MNVEENKKTVNQDLQTLTLIYIFKTLILFQKAKVCIMLQLLVVSYLKDQSTQFFGYAESQNIIKSH